MNQVMHQFIVILPEIMLTILALSMQVLGVFFKKCDGKIVLAAILLSFGIVFYLATSSEVDIVEFGFSFASSPLILALKAIVLILALFSLVIYYDFTKNTKGKFKIEFLTLILLSTLGIFISISARDFVLLFCGLELQALSGYALAAFNTKEVKSSEAGLKYFVLGALMSSLMLFGISFLYGFSGSIKFIEISAALNAGNNIGLVVGAVLMLSAVLFKLSVAPFHIWSPDVYEGAPISAVSYFAVAQKFGMLAVLITILDQVIGKYTQISVDIIKIVAVLSMIIGAFGAIMQSSLKRLLAYSSILNIGYVLVGVCLYSPAGNFAAYLYMFIYGVAVLGFLAALISLFAGKSDVVTFDDLRGVASEKKATAVVIAVLMFSMIGLPPFAGFFGKYYLFYQAMKQGEILLASLGVLTSVVAAFYYLKVIRYMYFMEAEAEISIPPTSNGLWIVTVLSMVFIMGFFIFLPTYIF